MQKFNRVILER